LLKMVVLQSRHMRMSRLRSPAVFSDRTSVTGCC
jgi:hypothetical protein